MIWEDKIFFYGASGVTTPKYYISNGTTEGTNHRPNVDTPYPANNFIVKNGFGYMFQGTSNGYTTSLIKVDFENDTTHVLLSLGKEFEDSEIFHIDDDYIYYVSSQDEFGSELYRFDLNLLNSSTTLPVKGTESISTCNKTIYDNGGPEENYQVNSDGSLEISPDNPNAKLIINFEEFDVRNNFDGLWITGASANNRYYGGTDGPGIITGNTGESVTIRLASDDGTVKPGFKAVVTCEYEVISSSTNLEASLYNLYPNPSSNNVTINAPINSAILVTDMNGNVMIETQNSAESKTIDISQLQEGLYIVNISNNGQTFTQTLSVVK